MSPLDRSLISNLPQFRDMSPDDLDHILRGARSQHIAKDKPIFEQDGEAHSFFLLLDGHLRVVKSTPDGNQVIVRYISAGELAGIAPAFGLNTYPATAIAAVDCVVLVWPTKLWAELSTRIPRFSANAYQVAGERMQDTHRMVVEMSTQQVEQRVAHTLLRLVRQTGIKTADGLLIDFPISRQDIAEMTGTTLHTVSRLLALWEEQGFIKSGRKKVTVVEAHQLLLLAEGRTKKA